MLTLEIDRTIKDVKNGTISDIDARFRILEAINEELRVQVRKVTKEVI